MASRQRAETFHVDVFHAHMIILTSITSLESSEAATVACNATRLILGTNKRGFECTWAKVCFLSALA